MSQKELLELLEKVHAEIERTDSVDEESRALLRHLEVDIRRLLENPDNSPGVLEQMEAAIRHFEVDHPVITATLSRVMEILSGSGI